jgi:recombination endonuclease VII
MTVPASERNQPLTRSNRTAPGLDRGLFHLQEAAESVQLKCSSCKAIKDEDSFHADKKFPKRNCKAYRCRSCMSHKSKAQANFEKWSTTDPYELQDVKFCKSCDREKPSTEFARDKYTRDGLQARCKSCTWKHHPSFYPMKEAQRFACFLCGSTERLALDHDHRCHPRGDVCEKCARSYLCDNCNVGLGRFRDNPSLLRSAADYIDFFNATLPIAK